MNKYFYYNYLTVAFTNLFVFAPYVLIQGRYKGLVFAIAISFLIGMLLLFLFTKTAQAYPNKDIFGIINETHQSWLLYCFISIKTILSIVSSILVVGGYTVIVSRYLNPHGNIEMLLILLLVAVGYAVTRHSLSVSYLVELMMFLTIPILIFIVFKTFTNSVFTWDTVLAVGQHYKQMPTLLMIAAGTFLFSGYSHLSLFIQAKTKPIKFKYCWPAPFLGLVILLITVIVPIGILGSETAANYLFVWSVAADATEMPYGFIERLVFIFIVALLSVAVTYTVSSLSQVIKVTERLIFSSKKKQKTKAVVARMSIYIYSVIASAIFIIVIFNNDFIFEMLANWYLIIHFFAEILFTCTLYLIARWKGRKQHA